MTVPIEKICKEDNGHWGGLFIDTEAVLLNNVWIKSNHSQWGDTYV
jgi:hypothetical protein